jgi:beta-glucuronidase
MNPGNFEAHIHNERYRDDYYAVPITHESWVCNHGRPTESLNGVWHYAVDQYDTCLRARWFEEQTRDSSGLQLPLDWDFDRWPTMELPISWNTADPGLFLYEGPMVFTRMFVWESCADERVFLRFGGAQYEAFVFLNGTYLGCHRGGSTPFAVEASDVIKEANRILVVVDNTRRSHQVPMTNTDWFNYGGIYRDVELVRVPTGFIRTTELALIPDGGFNQIRIRVVTDGTSETTATLAIPELHLREQIQLTNGVGVSIVGAQPQLWSPENPKLYECTISCGEDTVRDHVGFREIRVSGTRILLNGKEVFLRGISCHEDSKSGGKYLSPAEVEDDLRTAQELGCNYVRLAHYPHSEQTARVADGLGIMLWEEIPVYWAIDFTNDVTFSDAQNQLTELIIRDWNRASVIIWSVGNENADTDARLKFMRRLSETAHRLDPTRPVSAACLVDKVNNVISDRLAAHLDIIGLNEYFGWYDPEFDKLPRLLTNSKPSKPVIISETGAGALAGHRGSVDEYFTEDMQRNVYERQIQTLRTTDYVRGMSPWILFDFRCPRRTNRYQQGYNRKGLVAEDKRYRKPAFATLQRFYEELGAQDS